MTSYQRLKKRIEELEAKNKILSDDLYEVVLNPQSDKSSIIRASIIVENELEGALMRGRMGVRVDATLLKPMRGLLPNFL